MTFSPAIGGRADQTYDLASAFDAAIHGKRLHGWTAEVSAELSHKHGGSNVRVPLAALMQAKATGAGPLAGFGQALPLTGFSMDATVTDVGAAIRQELTAGRAGVRMFSTAEAVHKLPLVNARPTAAVYDIDAAIADGGDSGFGTVEIEPVAIATITEIANSLSFARDPNAVAIVSRHITDAITDAMDEAIWNGYATASGRAWAGVLASATPTPIVGLTNASTAADWRAVVEFQMAAMGTTSLQGMRWVSHPSVTSTLMVSPPFAGANVAMASMAGPAPLFGAEWIETLKLPVTAGLTDVLFGDFSSIVGVAFNSASIELIANPYETAAFAKGSTLLRAIASIGVGQTDAARICKTPVGV